MCFPDSVAHRILIADDSSVLRQILVDRLNGLEDMEVVGEAADGIEAIDRAEAVQPDVVVLDLQMPRMSGLEALRALRQRLPEAHIVVLTNHADPIYRRTCLAAGASRFLDKSLDLETLEEVIRDVVEA